MHAAKVRPLLRAFDQSCPNRVESNVVPFFRIRFTASQSMMESSGLKRTGRGTPLRKTVLPKGDPSFQRDLQIPWGAKKMEMIRHQQVVADQPCCCIELPDFVECLLNRRIRQPRFTLMCGDREKDPIWLSWDQVDAFGWRPASYLSDWGFRHCGEAYWSRSPLEMNFACTGSERAKMVAASHRSTSIDGRAELPLCPIVTTTSASAVVAGRWTETRVLHAT